MTINTLSITEYRWRRLGPELRARLRQAMGGKCGITGRQVLDITRDLCGRGAYDLVFHLYQALDGQPAIPYQGCGLGLLMNLRECMGEDPAPIGETLVLQVETGDARE